MVWYSHLFQNFPQFIVIPRVKGFGMVNKAEIDVFLELSCIFDDPRPRSGAAAERSNPTSKEWQLRGRRRAEKSYSTFKVRRGDLVQGRSSGCSLLEQP